MSLLVEVCHEGVAVLSAMISAWAPEAHRRLVEATGPPALMFLRITRVQSPNRLTDDNAVRYGYIGYPIRLLSFLTLDASRQRISVS
jgi:hypothetical protein